MVEMDYRTTKEKLKDQIIEETLRDVKRAMEARDLEEVKLIQTRINQLLILD